MTLGYRNGISCCIPMKRSRHIHNLVEETAKVYMKTSIIERIWGYAFLFVTTFCIAWLLMGVAHCQTPVILSPVPKLQFFDANGKPLAFGCVFSYQTLTTTPLATFTDYTGTIQNTNPIILNSGGFVGTGGLWLQAGLAYRLVVKSAGGSKCALGSTISTVDGVGGSTSTLTTIVPFSATPTFTATAQNQLFEITLTGNAVSQPLTAVGIIPPAIFTWQITQDSFGGRTFTWPANVIGGGTVDPTPNAISTQEFVWNGTTARALGPLMSGGAIYLPTFGGVTYNQVLYKNSGPIIHTGTTTADTIFTTTLPALTANSIVRVTVSWKPTVQGALAADVRVNLGGTNVSNASFNNAGGYTGSGIQNIVTISNLGSVSSQATDSVFSYSQNITTGQIVTSPSNTAAVNTGVPVTLTVTSQNGANSDSQTFYYILIELM